MTFTLRKHKNFENHYFEMIFFNFSDDKLIAWCATKEINGNFTIRGKNI